MNSPLHPDITTVLAAFANLLEDPKFSDVTVVVGNEEFKCHKVLLSQIPVIDRMLTVQMKENQQNTISLPSTDAGDFKKILKYLYTGCFEIQGWTKDYEVFKLAHLLQFAAMQNKLLSCLKASLVITNWSCVEESILLYDELKTHYLDFVEKKRYRSVISGRRHQ